MSIRAVIFDLYNTLLEVSPPPADAARRWEELWRGHLGGPVLLSLNEFRAAAAHITAREQAAMRAEGVDYPEIDWPAVAQEIMPELAKLSEAALAEFLFQQVALQHAVRLMPGATPALERLVRSGLVLGIASNAQAYTWRELDAALASGGLARSIFQAELCFLSFENRFSKPSPRVFHGLTAKLQRQEIAAAETLMVGDRLDNDVEPASAAGWQALHFQKDDPTESWRELERLVRQ